jgi:hypothetical protein
MLKGIMFASFLVLFLVASTAAQDPITSADAKLTAEKLIGENRLYCSSHPQGSGCIPEWNNSQAQEPLLVFTYPDLRPSYWLVPVLNQQGLVVSLIATSAKENKWQWFNRVQLETFPKVSENQARQICEQKLQVPMNQELKLVELPNKKLYWLCLADKGDLNQILVSVDDISDIHTNLSPDFSEITKVLDPIRSDHPRPERRSEYPQEKDPSYPESYNIENVPFYYQETSWYCGEAALQMVFDYWGEFISQDDIGDVANENPSYGTFADDLLRASHFSYISTAIQNPLLSGYNERELGYSSCEVFWSDPDHYSTRYDDLKELICSDYPVLVLTWYSGSHGSGHFRVIKGYDDWLNHLIVHDPWYSSPYFGPDVHFNQSFFVDDLWVYYDRWGLFSAPWQVELSIQPVVYPGDTFSVDLSFVYTAPHPFEDQYRASGISATLSTPSGYLCLPPPTPTVDFGNQYSGFAGDTTWQILAMSGGSDADTFRVVMEGLIGGYCGSYGTYEDRIGKEGEAITAVVQYICGDVNRDYLVNTGDVIFLLNYLYREGPTPEVPESGDVNLDTVIGPGDVVFLLNYLFRGGPEPSC